MENTVPRPLRRAPKCNDTYGFPLKFVTTFPIETSRRLQFKITLFFPRLILSIYNSGAVL